MTERKFCPQCGDKQLIQQSIKHWKCKHCQFIYFHNCASAVAAIITCQHEVLLAVRKNEPGKGLYDLPGGFVDYNETLEKALTREIKEELQLNIDDWQYYCSYPNKYQYQNVLYHTVDAFFTKVLANKVNAIAGDDVASAVWKPIDSINLNEIAFDSTRQAIQQLQKIFPSKPHQTQH